MDDVVVMKLKGVGYSELEVTVKGFRAGSDDARPRNKIIEDRYKAELLTAMVASESE